MNTIHIVVVRIARFLAAISFLVLAVFLAFVAHTLGTEGDIGGNILGWLLALVFAYASGIFLRRAAR